MMTLRNRLLRAIMGGFFMQSVLIGFGCASRENMAQETQPPNQSVPEMVGATNSPVHLDKSIGVVSVPLHQPTGPALANTAQMRVTLNVENITSDQPAPVYEVYLNVPPGDEPSKHPELLVGTLPMFGLEETTRPDNQHPGNGLNYRLDATAVFLRLSVTKDWDSKNLRVTFVPTGLVDWEPNVRVGRISVYFG
jgi:hypothetical protein